MRDMTQNEKELLLSDLCARLPYNTIVHGVYAHQNQDFDTESDYITYKEMDNILTVLDIEWIQMCAAEVKPYLFPLSSMTDEQLSYIHFNTKFNIDRFGTITPKIDEDNFPVYVDMEDWISLYCWLNKNHLDYRGLIEKGLALDATGLNIY